MFVLAKAKFSIKLEVRLSSILAEPLLGPKKGLHKSTRLDAVADTIQLQISLLLF